MGEGASKQTPDPKILPQKICTVSNFHIEYSDRKHTNINQEKPLFPLHSCVQFMHLFLHLN